MRARRFGFGFGLALALMTAVAPPGAAASREQACFNLFRAYDRAVRFNSGGGQLEGRVISRNAEPRADRLRDAGCITREADFYGVVTPANERAAAGVRPSGVPIARTWLHVGIVPGVVTEIQVRSFFGALGLGVRGIGAPTLGRRIFVGPFTDAGALAEAAEIAREAGFVAPYPRRFGT